MTGDPRRDEAGNEPRRVPVGPDDVWQPGAPGRPRWAHRSFFAPILAVVALSAAMLYGLLTLGVLAWRWLR